MQNFSRRWIYMALVYFCLAVSLGVFMGLTRDHSLMTVHAHLNLLGWVTQALVGIIYHFFPKAGASRLATLQFWLHSLALPVLMGALAMLVKGHAALEPVVGMSSLAVMLGVFLFAGNILSRRG